MKRTLALPLVLLLFSSPVFAEYYRWIDKNGRESFTNNRSLIPPEYRASATTVTTDADRVTVSGAPAAPARHPEKTAEHRDRFGRGEEYWHRKAENLRLKLRDLQDEHDAVVQQIADREKNELPRRGKKKKTEALEKKKTKLENEIRRTKRVLEVDLPDEARRADAYPGWLRE